MLKQNEDYSHFALAFILLADCLIREKRPPSGAINLQINSYTSESNRDKYNFLLEETNKALLLAGLFYI
jgi:CBS-domain-containing membrane protein